MTRYNYLAAVAVLLILTACQTGTVPGKVSILDETMRAGHTLKDNVVTAGACTTGVTLQDGTLTATWELNNRTTQLRSQQSQHAFKATPVAIEALNDFATLRQAYDNTQNCYTATFTNISAAQDNLTVTLTTTIQDVTDQATTIVERSNDSATSDDEIITITPDPPIAGEPAVLTAQAPNQSNANYTWRVNNETIGTNQSLTYTFTETTSYTVTVDIISEAIGATENEPLRTSLQLTPVAEDTDNDDYDGHDDADVEDSDEQNESNISTFTLVERPWHGENITSNPETSDEDTEQTKETGQEPDQESQPSQQNDEEAQPTTEATENTTQQDEPKDNALPSTWILLTVAALIIVITAAIIFSQD